MKHDRISSADGDVTARTEVLPAASRDLLAIAVLVTQVTEITKVDIVEGLQHDARMIGLRARRIARDGLLGSHLPLVLLIRRHGG